MARPKKEINEEEVFKLASMMCTMEEIAAWFNVDKSTISRRFATVVEKGKEVGKISLRRKQWKLADTSAAVAIFLGKNYLGQSDKIDVVEDIYINETIEFMSEEDNLQGRDALDKFLMN